jgi:hypothetical protein
VGYDKTRQDKAGQGKTRKDKGVGEEKGKEGYK